MEAQRNLQKNVIAIRRTDCSSRTSEGKEDDGSGVDDEIQKLVDERQAARKAKNFARADENQRSSESQGHYP
jgi:cysteinyl-tRNA synthetase